jgi:CheY-like chemotaxis protein
VQSGTLEAGPAELKIFLVEDNPADVVLFKRILRSSHISYALTVAIDGGEALDVLKTQDVGRQHYRPDVVFLDLNLPGKSGIEVLAEMKADVRLAAISVAVLTGSDSPEDRAACSLLGADIYLSKALGLDHFPYLAREVEQFLINLSRPMRSELAPRRSISAA